MPLPEKPQPTTTVSPLTHTELPQPLLAPHPSAVSVEPESKLKLDDVLVRTFAEPVVGFPITSVVPPSAASEAPMPPSLEGLGEAPSSAPMRPQAVDRPK